MSRTRPQTLLSKFILLLFALVIAVALTGCGSIAGTAGANNNGGSGGSNNPPPPPPPPPDPGPGPAPGPGPTPPPPGGGGNFDGMTALNHIVFMIEENRSLDTYFGQLETYRVMQGLPAGQFDGIPADGTSPCANASPSTPPDADPNHPCMPINLRNNDYHNTITMFHLKTMCIENTSNAWYESHQNFNLFDLTSDTPGMDGFAWSAGGDAAFIQEQDVDGRRAMGFYDWNDLPYHYFMATQFATSDRWFSPAPTETEPNKMYEVAATSVGHAHTPQHSVNAKTIFELLENAHISWKIYYTRKPSDAILNFFQPFASQHAANIQPIANYFSDLANGTLPQVAMIEPAFAGGEDEHPGLGNNIQVGVAESAKYINALMTSSSWKDSAFILTFDESGGLFDHVPPPTQGVPNPDGIPPQDLFTSPPADPPGDFTRYGFRVPLIVVSPFARKNYVSHTVTDATSILRFIEVRFNLPLLTKRDAVAMDMTEFFNWKNPPWLIPPSPPTQPTNGACYDGLP